MDRAGSGAARVAIIGASGYTGAELVRILSDHPGFRIVALCANSKAGQPMAAVFPHLRHLDLPVMGRVEDTDFSGLDLIFCALPHGTSQAVIRDLPRDRRIVDLSADFRLRDMAAYRQWYGADHAAPDCQAEAVYGLTEFYRDAIRGARIVACTGCNAMAGNMATLPLLAAGVIDPDEIVISLATGVSGAGRAAKETMLHAEVSEGFAPYALGGHRHMAEFEQEMSRAAGRPVSPTFIPHLIPANRGILATVFVRGDAAAIHAAFAARYAAEPFVTLLPLGEGPSTRHIRGSNHVHVGVAADRRPGRAIVFTALDNLTKGSSGMAVQNANVMLGYPETQGLTFAPVFP
jgi:N-acetyl-gamma-glutamyl-phosphate reductase